MKVPHSAAVHKHPAHPWVVASCIIFGLGILAAAAFWIRKLKSSSVPRHEYSALRLENCTERSSSLDRQIKDGTFSTCGQYLAAKGRYELQGSLGNIGSRPDKQWFVANDRSLGADRLLSLIEIPSSAPIKPSAATRETLLELFRSLQHPYVHPVLDVEFWEIGAAFISPLNERGSLKDLIYGTTWRDPYDRKYHSKGSGLPYRQVQCLGRQILEALLFLHNRSFPRFYHLHSGNVIIQNGVARLAALENTLLGLPPKPPAANDSTAFGYVLFEMSAGYELPTPPSTAHLQIELERTPKIAETLSTIFDSADVPSIEDLLREDLFRGVELRELHRTTGISYTTSSEVMDLLDMVRESITPPSPQSSGCGQRSLAVQRYRSRSKTAEFCTVRGKTYMQILDDCDNQI